MYDREQFKILSDIKTIDYSFPTVMSCIVLNVCEVEFNYS